MANGDENNRKTDKTDLQIARERLDVQREMAGLKKGVTTDDKFSLSLANKLINIAQNHLDIENQRLDLTRESKDVAKDLLKAETNRKRILQQIKKDGGDNSKILKENLDLSEQIVAELKKEEKSVKKIEDSFGLTGASLGVINKLLGGQIPNLKNISEETRNRLAKLEKENKLLDGTLGKFQAFGIQVSEIGKAIGKNMLDPLVLIGIALNYSKELADLQKGFGISRKEALGLRIEAGAIASETGNIAIQSKDVLKTITELNKQFGTTSTILRDDIVSEMSKLGKLTDMSAESQANFARFANMSGKNAAVITKETRRAVVNAEQEKGLRVDINETLDEAGKINGQIAAQLGGNVTKLAQAVTVAKQFGMTLEGVAAAGAQLLNFESSISNELEAELLIGKELNLERARLAALTGDYETLTREINANIGDFGDFTKMNVIQQEALAKSVGMTADGLSDILLKNENIEALAQEARLAGDEDLAKQLEARSAQEKFNDTVAKLKGLFTDIVGGPLSGILDLFGNILGAVGSVVKFIGLGQGGLADFGVKLLVAYKILGPMITGFKTIKTLMASIKLSQIGINTAKGIGLITQQQSNNAKARATILAANEGNIEKLNNFTKNAGLFTLIKTNAQRTIANIREGFNLGLKKASLITEGSITLNKQLQNRSMLGLIAKGAIRLAQAVGVAVASIASASALTLGLGAIAIAGGIALAMGAFSSAKSSIVEDGTAPSSKGPFTIMDKFGATSVTTAGDNVVVSPNVNKGNNNTNNISMSETNNIMKEQNQLLSGILNKPNFESLWAGGNEGTGNRASGEIKYGNIQTGFN